MIQSVETVKTVLRLDDYDTVCSEWVLLASLDAAVPTEPGPRVDALRGRGPGPRGRGRGHVERVTREGPHL